MGRRYLRKGNRRIYAAEEILNQDNNDRFVAIKCAAYMQRHAARYPFHEKEVLEMICWVLGEFAEELGSFLLSKIPPTEYNEFSKTLSESTGAPDDLADIYCNMLAKLRTSHITPIRKHILSLLKEKAASLRFRGASDIEKGIGHFQKMFCLTEDENEFCILLYILTSYEKAENLFVSHLRCNTIPGKKYLANILGMSHGQINKVLSGTLKRIELYEFSKYSLALCDDFMIMLQETNANFTSKFFVKAKTSPIPLEQHFVQKEITEHLTKILQDKQEAPSHILLYGPPGTGKSSYALGLAKKMNIPCFKIQQGNDDNESRTRRAAITACLNLTNNNPAGSLVLVDEADNLLNTRESWFMRGETQDQGWLNTLLEEPGVRIIWVTNRIDDIEESVLRRFSFSLQFKPFNRRQRIQLWDQVARGNKVKRLLSDADIARLAGKYQLSAGIIGMAVKKAKQASPQKEKELILRALELTLESHALLKNKGRPQPSMDSLEKNYSIDGLNISGDLPGMLEQLNRFDAYIRRHEDEKRLHMNLLFYGEPGTGKSELARYIAKRLDREIICKRASDILDPYVGMTERKLSEAFAEAQAEEAILVLDEADTLLFSRDQARHSWEISFTNEFLTQLEHYRGILICTTNRFDGLDSASIRRFNFKIEFKRLTSEGNIVLYLNLLGRLLDIPPNRSEENQLKSLTDLTPGDFKTVRDKYRFYGKNELNHSMLIAALRKEIQQKARNSGCDKKLGFLD